MKKVLQAKHTPGPWFNRGPLGAGRWINSEKGQIAVVYGPSVTPEGDANANLVAAAPELLAALQLARGCIAYCRKFHKDIQSGDGFPAEIIIDAAIAKATGKAVRL
jgi:hypothetical protein